VQVFKRWRVVPLHLVQPLSPRTRDFRSFLHSTNNLDMHDQVARQVAKAIVESAAEAFRSVDKVHNHPYLIRQLPEGPTALI
jgi:hypothetical protein